MMSFLFLTKSRNCEFGSSWHGAAETNPTGNHEVSCSISGLTQCVEDLALLCLWPAATALIGPFAWQPPYATSAALKDKRPKKKKKKEIVNLCSIMAC